MIKKQFVSAQIFFSIVSVGSYINYTCVYKTSRHWSLKQKMKFIFGDKVITSLVTVNKERYSK